KVWDLQSDEMKTTAKTLEGHTDSVRSVAFSPDCPQLASWSDDGTIKTWDLQEEKLLKTIDSQRIINCSCAYSNGYFRCTGLHLSDSWGGASENSHHFPLHDFHVYKHDSNTAIIIKWGERAMVQLLYNLQPIADDSVAFTMLSSRSSVKACVGIG